MSDAASIVDRLDLGAMNEAAQFAAEQLKSEGFTAVVVQPGDMTRYGFVLIDQHRPGTVKIDSGGRYLFGSTFGRLRALPDPVGRIDYGYIEANYIDKRYANMHTAVVYSEFIRLVGRQIAQAAEVTT
ncbi:MAG: hypothetical protein WBM50_15455 [Acidimicrobiales bacterium]